MAKSVKPAKIEAPVVVELPVLVAGHKVTENGGVFVIFKDKVGKNKKFTAIGKDRATRTGSRFMPAGTTLEQAQLLSPVGSVEEGAFWGPQNTDAEYDNVFFVLFEGEELVDVEGE